MNNLKMIPLGGLGRVGMNMTVFEHGNNIVVVDAGLAFPEEDMLGIDLVLPDIRYLLEHADKVRAIVITHGHEDHIGALTYVLPQLNVPVYATRLTMGIIDHKLEEKGLLESTRRHVVQFGDILNFGSISVEFIKTNHSIQDAAALAIRTPVGMVVHTGDFKVDYTPVYGDAINLQRFAELGREGVMALLSDSTNAERPGFTMSERSVGATIDKIFTDHKEGRIIIATFASNVDRVQQILNSAHRFGRKVVVVGRSMVAIIATAGELGYLDIPENLMIPEEEMKNYPDEELVIISTGSQGESMAALSRMAYGIHRKISIRPTDTIIFSSHTIPGNEKAVYNIINKLTDQGAEVIFEDVHVSGHACEEELKLLYTLTSPEYAIPIHGEYRHLKANADIAKSLGIPADRVITLHNGDVLEFSGHGNAQITDAVPCDAILVDGLGVGDIGNTVLRDRQKLSEDGVFIVAMTLDAVTGELLAEPEVASRGFVYVKESDDLMQEAKEVLMKRLEKPLSREVVDVHELRGATKESMAGFLWERTNRKPIVIPIIMEV